MMLDVQVGLIDWNLLSRDVQVDSGLIAAGCYVCGL